MLGRKGEFSYPINVEQAELTPRGPTNLSIMTTNRIKIAITSGAYNEEECIEEFINRCLNGTDQLNQQTGGRIRLDFTYIIADNKSDDKTLEILAKKSREHENIIVFANRRNYGTEASGINLLYAAKEYDIVGILCSDLQDPPEHLMQMLCILLLNTSKDAVIGLKESSRKGPLIEAGRHLYYRIGKFFTRGQAAPFGYHGFGVYRKEVIQSALEYYENTNQTVRDCLIKSSSDPYIYKYKQAARRHGTSSYGNGLGYIPVAARSILNSDAASSRTALTISCISMALAACIFVYIIIMTIPGKAGYVSGIATVISVSLITFTAQMLQFGILARQIESTLRPRIKVKFDIYSKNKFDGH